MRSSIFASLLAVITFITACDCFRSQSHALRLQSQSRALSMMSYGGKLTAEANFAATVISASVNLLKEVEESMATAKDQAGSLGTTVDKGTADGSTAGQKADDTPVTAADYGIQGFIAACLTKEFPNDFFMGEEDGSDLRADPGLLETARSFAAKLSGNPSLSAEEFLVFVDRGVEPRPEGKRVWILDPIDGTKGLITGQQYVVGLALVENGEAILGAMGNPAKSPSIMIGAKNEGLRFVSASDPKKWILPQDAISEEDESKSLGLSEVWQKKKYDYSRFRVDGEVDDWGCGLEIPSEDYPPFLLSRPMDVGSPLPFGPCAGPSNVCCGAMVKYWAVATAGVAGFVQFQSSLKSWDHACGVVCVQESGGEVCDGKGEPIRFDDRAFEVAGGVVCVANGADEEASKMFKLCADPYYLIPDDEDEEHSRLT